MYQQMIKETLISVGLAGTVDPRHVEGWMRVDSGCLDHLSRAEFNDSVMVSVRCIAAMGVADSEDLAKSMGL